jgi:MFS family permease
MPRNWTVVESPRDILMQFALMSFIFGVGNSSMNMTVNLAIPELGRLGQLGVSVALLVYCTSALLIASSMVKILGTKRVLVLALLLSYAYGLCLFVTYNWHQNNWQVAAGVVMCIGSVLGGSASGMYWTAQGVFFSAMVASYAAASKNEVDFGEEDGEQRSSSKLSSVFATLLIGCEVVVNLSVSAVMRLYGADDTGINFVFFALPSFLAMAAVCMAVLVKEPEFNRRARTGSVVEVFTLKKMKYLGSLLMADRRLILLSPFTVAYGLMSSMINFYVATMVANSLGAAQIGNLSALLSGVATLMSVPVGRLGSYLGKPVLMLFGLSCSLCECGVLFTLGDKVGTWFWLITVYVLHGVARAVAEGTQKGLLVDYFAPNQTAEGAFANWVLWDGLSQAIGLFTFPMLSGRVMVLICAGALIFAAFCFGCAEFVHRKSNQTDEECEPLIP